MRATVVLWAAMAVLACGATPVSAQFDDEDPFPPAETPFEVPSFEPPAEQPAPEPPARAPESETPPPPPPPSPAVATIIESNPTTAPELLEAIDLLTRLDRPDLAQQYFQQLTAQPWDVPALAQLHQQFGSAAFLRLARNEALGPAGGEFAMRVLQAARQVARDPARLRQQTQQLVGGSLTDAKRAAAQLLRAGSAAVPPLVDQFASASPDGRRRIVTVLMHLGDETLEPLLAYRDHPEAARRKLAVQLLGQTRAAGAAPFLVGPWLGRDSDPDLRQTAEQALRQVLGEVPSRTEAITLAERAAERAWQIARGAAPSATPEDIVWSWDPQANTAASRQVPATVAAAFRAARLYDDLHQVDPAVSRYEIRDLTARLQTEQWLVGLDNSLRQQPGTPYDLLTEAGPATTEQVLTTALENQLIAAAIGAVRVLHDIGSREQLLTTDGQPAPLITAMRSPDRRLQFVAAQAVQKLSRNEPFPGDSYLADTLGFLASSTGSRRVLIGHPRLGTAQTWAGILAEMGYEAELATTGRDVLRHAVQSADYELVLLSDALAHPEIDPLIQRLRQDSRTARLPIGILSRLSQRDANEQLTQYTDRLRVFVESNDPADLGVYVAQLQQLHDDRTVSAEGRLAQAAIALQLLQELAQHQCDPVCHQLGEQFGMLQRALEHPSLAPAAAELIGHVPRPAAQVALSDYAQQPLLPDELRRAAVEAFSHSVQQFGILLDNSQIRQLVQRHRQTETTDPQTHQLLGELIQTLEQRRGISG